MKRKKVIVKTLVLALVLIFTASQSGETVFNDPNFGVGASHLQVVRITTLGDGVMVNGTIIVDVYASEGAKYVSFYIDGEYQGNDKQSPYNYRWNTRRYPNGRHTLYVKAFYPDLRQWIPSPAVKVDVNNPRKKWWMSLL